MGVSGSGKSTFGKVLSDHLSASFIEGDALHPDVNIRKMASGEPLEDADRWPWLTAIRDQCDALLKQQRFVVVACSALRSSYRAKLREVSGETLFVYLQGDRSTIEQRMSARKDHFMPTGLIDSQFATLEPPAEEADVVTVDINLPLKQQCTKVILALSE